MTATPTPPANEGSSHARKASAGPRGHWLFGCIPEVRKDPLGLYARAWQQYGDYVRLRAIPRVCFYLLTHPDAIDHVLQRNHKNYRKPEVLLGPMRLLVGEGLFTSEGPAWLRQRRLDQPAFHRDHLAGLGPLVVAAADDFLRRRESAAPGEPFDMLAEMMRLALQVAGTTLVSTDISSDANAIGAAYRTAFAYIGYRMKSSTLLPLWFPTRRTRTFDRARALLDRVVLELIEKRRRAGNGPKDLLSLLLAAQDEATGAGMSDRQLEDEILTLLTAGHETMGAALAWTWYLLGQHPRVQEDLRDEVLGNPFRPAPFPDPSWLAWKDAAVVKWWIYSWASPDPISPPRPGRERPTPAGKP
jgi:cytochrome P450